MDEVKHLVKLNIYIYIYIYIYLTFITNIEMKRSLERSRLS